MPKQLEYVDEEGGEKQHGKEVREGGMIGGKESRLAFRNLSREVRGMIWRRAMADFAHLHLQIVQKPLVDLTLDRTDISQAEYESYYCHFNWKGSEGAGGGPGGPGGGMHREGAFLLLRPQLQRRSRSSPHSPQPRPDARLQGSPRRSREGPARCPAPFWSGGDAHQPGRRYILVREPTDTVRRNASASACTWAFLLAGGKAGRTATRLLRSRLERARLQRRRGGGPRPGDLFQAAVVHPPPARCPALLSGGTSTQTSRTSSSFGSAC